MCSQHSTSSTRWVIWRLVSWDLTHGVVEWFLTSVFGKMPTDINKTVLRIEISHVGERNVKGKKIIQWRIFALFIVWECRASSLLAYFIFLHLYPLYELVCKLFWEASPSWRIPRNYSTIYALHFFFLISVSSLSIFFSVFDLIKRLAFISLYRLVVVKIFFSLLKILSWKG